MASMGRTNAFAVGTAVGWGKRIIRSEKRVAGRFGARRSTVMLSGSIVRFNIVLRGGRRFVNGAGIAVLMEDVR